MVGARMTAVSGTGTNIRRVGLNTKEAGMFGTVLVEVENQTHLTKVMRAMRRVKGVTAVDRREPAARSTDG